MSIIIQLENLHWSASAADIRYFFRGLEIPEGGVHIIGGENGDAFIAFENDQDAMLAMEKDGLRLKNNYVKLSYSTQGKLKYMVEQVRSGHVDRESPDRQDCSAYDDGKQKNLGDYSPHRSREHSFEDSHHSSVKGRLNRKSSGQRDKFDRKRPPRWEAGRHRDKSLDRVSEIWEETGEMQFPDVRKDHHNLPERGNPPGDLYNQYAKLMFRDERLLSLEKDLNYDNRRDVAGPQQFMQSVHLSYEDPLDMMKINMPQLPFDDMSHEKYSLREERNFKDDYLNFKPHQQHFIERDIRDERRYSPDFQNREISNLRDSYQSIDHPRQIQNFPPNFCIRLSGLDTKATFKEVHALLRGYFAPQNNIKWELDHHGYKTGTALVQMNNNEDYLAILALGETKANNQRATISKCSDEIFYKCFRHLRNRSPVEKSFGRNRMDFRETGDLCYMLKGIPFAAEEEDVINFFNGIELLDMFILYDNNRKAIGTGFVQFFNVDDYNKAMERQGQKIGHRYIQLLECTLEDVKSAKADAACLSKPLRVVLNERMYRIRNLECLQNPLQKRPLCVVVSGLPPSTTNFELFEFFEQCGTRPNAIHNLLHSKGSSSGRAYVEFNDLFGLDVALKQQGQYFGENVISVKQVLFNEMLKILELHPVHHEFSVIRKRYSNTNAKTEDTPEKMPYVWEPFDDVNDEQQSNSHRGGAQNFMGALLRGAIDSNQSMSAPRKRNRSSLRRRRKMESERNLSEFEPFDDRKPKDFKQFERNEGASSRRKTDFRKQGEDKDESNQFHMLEKRQRFSDTKEPETPVWLNTQQNFSAADSNLLVTEPSIVRDKRNDAPSAQRRNNKLSSRFKKGNYSRPNSDPHSRKTDVTFHMGSTSNVSQLSDQNNGGRWDPLPEGNIRSNLDTNRQQSFRANDKARNTFDVRENDKRRKLTPNQREDHPQRRKDEKRTSPSKSHWKTELEHTHLRSSNTKSNSKSDNRDNRETKTSGRGPSNESRNQHKSYEKEPQANSTTCTVQASNVPIYAEIHNIFRFFDGFQLCAENIIRRYTNEGLPTGDIRATFEYANDARNAVKLLNGCKMDGSEIFLRLV